MLGLAHIVAISTAIRFLPRREAARGATPTFAMQILRRKLLEASRRLPLFYAAPRGRAHAIATLAAASRWAPPAGAGSLAAAPWAATQRRGAKMLGSDVRIPSRLFFITFR
jgi:hypothetical protein